MLQTLGGAALTDGVNALLSGLQDFLGGAGALLNQSGDIACGFGNFSQKGFVFDDGGVLLDMGRCRGDIH